MSLVQQLHDDLGLMQLAVVAELRADSSEDLRKRALPQTLALKRTHKQQSKLSASHV